MTPRRIMATAACGIALVGCSGDDDRPARSETPPADRRSTLADTCGQRSERIPVEVDPAMRHVVPPQEVPGGFYAGSAAATDDRGPDSVHAALWHRLS
jgi:hypothetical protein